TGLRYFDVKVEFMFIVRPALIICICIVPFAVSDPRDSTRIVPTTLVPSRLHSILTSCLLDDDEITVRVQLLSSLPKARPFSISSLVMQDVVVVVRGAMAAFMRSSIICRC